MISFSSNILSGKRLIALLLVVSLMGSFVFAPVTKAQTGGALSLTLTHEIIDKKDLKLKWTVAGPQEKIDQIDLFSIEVHDEYTRYSGYGGPPSKADRELLIPNNFYSQNEGFNLAHNYSLKISALDSNMRTLAEATDSVLNVGPSSPSKPNNVQIAKQIDNGEPFTRITFEKATERADFYAIYRDGQQIKNFNYEANTYAYNDTDVDSGGAYTYYVSTVGTFGANNATNSVGPIIVSFQNEDTIKQCNDLYNKLKVEIARLEKIQQDLEKGVLKPDETTQELVNKSKERINSAEQEIESAGCAKNPDDSTIYEYQKLKDRADVAISNAQGTYNRKAGRSSSGLACSKITGGGTMQPIFVTICYVLDLILQMVARAAAWIGGKLAELY